EQGPLGFPTSDETGAPDSVGRYSYFQHGGIYWSAQTGARASILFRPFYGAESAHDGGAYKLQSPSVYLIFWGSYWLNDPKAQGFAVRDAVSGVLNSSYLSGLTQYGSDGVASYGGMWFDNSDPANGFSTDDVDHVIQKSINDPNSSFPKPPIF